MCVGNCLRVLSGLHNERERSIPTNNCILDCTTIVGVISLHIKLLGM